MYGLVGGLTSLFHLAVRFPILVSILGLTGFAALVPGNPGVGDRVGTTSILTQTENKLVKEHPELANKILELRKDFDRQSSQPTERQALEDLLKITDAGTDVHAEDILKNPEERREAAWLIYLNKKFLNKHGPPPQRK